MELQIKSDTSIIDLQKQFNSFYPFLQIQFLRNEQPEEKSVQKMKKVQPDALLKQLIRFYEPFKLTVSNETTVAQLLKDFKKVGLIAQLNRRSGNLWIEICLTDDWTLKHQNEEAGLITLSS